MVINFSMIWLEPIISLTAYALPSGLAKATLLSVSLPLSVMNDLS